MDFTKTKLKLELEITHLFTLHYFEFAKDYIFEGEQHDFWELVYVDAGEIEVTADDKGYLLKQGDIIFHKPNEHHSLWANNRNAPNIVVVTFECLSPIMHFFENKMFNLGDRERNLLASTVKYGFLAFEPPFDDPRNNQLIKKLDASFGAEQYIRIHLELLLMSIISQGYADTGGNRLSTAAKERSENDVISKLIAYMEANVAGDLTLEQMCDHLHISKTFIVRLFKQKTGQSIIKYYKNLKIEKAKSLIRERQHNFTEIAEILQYTSIHSFSRHFKHVTDQTPSEYSRSIQARI
ncbi:AraC family transcriptional regulator [Cohnella abietis]|uniref:HTH araC/xylS-type domain-containing protein n=1 Tax=Cohnella abietis TaxID=2507935 RepID=A0A3T1DAS2_9BACL|nr:AraC family transcriptional regulator [Cohnella abietis]BBI35207.1 hypothetical protein KCTCHS21_46060 [Cohnella abietis]